MIKKAYVIILHRLMRPQGDSYAIFVNGNINFYSLIPVFIDFNCKQ